MTIIDNVDICCGLAWGDEVKGKIVTELIKKYNYDWICRWVEVVMLDILYLNDNKYFSNIVPSGVFYNKKSYIGPQCYVNLIELDNEMEYLSNNGFNINNIKISPLVHIVTNKHKEEDSKKYKNSPGSTGKGIAPCAKDKYGRIGIRLVDILDNETYFENLKFFDRKKHNG